jgi:hypothetical protein
MLKKITKTCLLASLLVSISSISTAKNTNLQQKWEEVTIPSEIRFGGKFNKGEDGKLYIAGIEGAGAINAVYQLDKDTWKRVISINNNARNCYNEFVVDKTSNIYFVCGVYGREITTQVFKYIPNTPEPKMIYAFNRSKYVRNITIKNNGLLLSTYENSHKLFMFDLTRDKAPTIVIETPSLGGAPVTAVQSATKVFLSRRNSATEHNEILELTFENERWNSKVIASERHASTFMMGVSQKNLYFDSNGNLNRYDLALRTFSKYNRLNNGAYLVVGKLQIDDKETAYISGSIYRSGQSFSAVFTAKPHEVDLQRVGGDMLNRYGRPETEAVTGLEIIGTTVYALPSISYMSANNLYKYQQ